MSFYSLLKQVNKAIVQLLLLFLAVGTFLISPLNAQTKKYHFRYGLSWHRIVLTDGYGEFLNDRYGAEHVDMAGSYLGFVYQLNSKFGIGGRTVTSKGSIKYKTLNDESEEFSMSYTALIATASWYMSPSIEILGGFGFDNLKRKSYGYADASIVTSNLEDNSGQAEVETFGTVFEGQVIYRAFGDRGASTTFGLELAATYTYAAHVIDSSDKRPAYDSRGQPIASTFDLSGFGYTVNLSIDF
ncbi:MAG: hypothetical protein MJE63_33085 [Proteobacteria bacterium]|nr:hypothetical protein [Pseudomonadota bacterium]